MVLLMDSDIIQATAQIIIAEHVCMYVCLYVYMVLLLDNDIIQATAQIIISD